MESLRQPGAKPEEAKEREYQAFYNALRSISPCSELEGMLAVQMIAVHNGEMECMRRAMLEGQTFEGREQNLKQAAKWTGLYERQLAVLDKHRGKGQQKITWVVNCPSLSPGSILGAAYRVKQWQVAARPVNSQGEQTASGTMSN